MATLKEAIQFAQQNPQDPRSVELARRLGRGDFDSQAQTEGIDLSPIQRQVPQQVQKPLGLVPTQERRGFFREEFAGGADISELTGAKKFGAELFQSTLGSKGLLGAFQLPGKVIGAKSAIEAQTELEQERGETFEAARKLKFLLDKETDPKRLATLRKVAVGLDESLRFLEEAQRGLDRFAPTPKEALGTAVSAAVTVAPVGRLIQGSRAITVLREALRGTGFVTGGALTEDRIPTAGELAAGATIGAAVPVVGKAVSGVIKKAFGIAGQITKSLAGAVGVSVDDIFRNPKVAQQTAEKLLGGAENVASVLRKEAQKLLTNVQTFRQGLRRDFGKALESLSETQIAVQDIKNAAIKALGDNGIRITKTGINMEAAEFTSQVMQKRALGIINEINNLKSLDGKTLRNLIGKIEALKFKTPGADPERLAFNATMKDLSRSLGDAVAKTTPELQAANKSFSEGMQIVEVMEQEFGKVQFTNLKELNVFAKKLEGLLKKKGIAPEVIDDFLVRVGEDPTAFRATEAVRGAFEKRIEAEAAGINPITLIRSLTAGIISPKDATRLTIAFARLANVSEKVVKPFVDTLIKLQPATRVALIKILVDAFQSQVVETRQQ